MTDNLKVLIVEDEPTIANLLKKILMQLGCDEVYTCTNALCAFEVVQKEDINLIFMDLNIEGKIDGIQCAKQILRNHNVMITFATSYSDEATLEEAIDVNTLNYLVKPYGKKDIEITLTLAKVSLRKNIKKLPIIETAISIGDYNINTNKRQTTFKKQEVPLTKKEFDLLVLLARNSHTTVSTKQIIKEIWNNKNIASSTLREIITRLRKKLPTLNINAKHGLGYQITSL